MKTKLPRVQSQAKDVAQVSSDLNQLQSGAFPKIEMALNQAVSSQSFTATVTGTILEGYIQVETPYGTFWLQAYTQPM